MNERLLVALPLRTVNPSGLTLSRVRLLWLGRCWGLVAIAPHYLVHLYFWV